MANAARLAIGLMSGTSMDGIDAALIETDGVDHVRPVHGISLAYSAADRAAVAAAVHSAKTHPTRRRHAEADRCATMLAERHAEAVAALLSAASVPAADVATIGFHGQTIRHMPPVPEGDSGWTWQIGDAGLLAALTGIDVIADFRHADMAAGGQGAPLVPLYHRVLVAQGQAAGRLPMGPVCVLNIGGVANVTWIDGDALLAFDTGPGNALIDDWVQAATGARFDADGALAARGAVHSDVLTAMLDNPWFDQPPPKSLDRDDFSASPLRGLSAADGAATLATFTARTIALSRQHMPRAPVAWVVAGGGRRNPAIMNALAQAVGAVRPVDALAWDGDLLEAQAFAYLAVRSSAGLPLSLPGTTGVAAPTRGGLLYRAALSRLSR
ncbi:MAG: anhydro-N-acetylmuramic acid kinase [Sphingomonadales bacterium]|nr:MAG: anhydro-N-acetylmuramic acid kinase [Sphingomonadales bacterium]